MCLLGRRGHRLVRLILLATVMAAPGNVAEVGGGRVRGRRDRGAQLRCRPGCGGGVPPPPPPPPSSADCSLCPADYYQTRNCDSATVVDRLCARCAHAPLCPSGQYRTGCGNGDEVRACKGFSVLLMHRFLCSHRRALLCGQFFQTR